MFVTKKKKKDTVTLEWLKLRLTAYRKFVQEHKKQYRKMLAACGDLYDARDDLQEQITALQAKLDQHNEVIRQKEEKYIEKMKTLHEGMQTVEADAQRYAEAQGEDFEKTEVEGFVLNWKKKPASVVLLETEDGKPVKPETVVSLLKKKGLTELMKVKESLDKNAIKKAWQEEKIADMEISLSDLEDCYLSVAASRDFIFDVPDELKTETVA